MYWSDKKKHTKIKKSVKVAHSSDKECNRILQSDYSYYTKSTALKYPDFTLDVKRHQRKVVRPRDQVPNC